MTRGVLAAGLLAIGALFGFGCVVPSQEAIRRADTPIQESQAPQSAIQPGKGALIKPVIPPSAEPTSLPTAPPDNEFNKYESSEQSPASKTDNPFEEKPVPAGAKGKAAEPLPSPAKRTGTVKKEWEDQKVRNAAVEMAKASPLVEQIKICYSVREHEWWVVLYERGDGFIELKQYIFNYDSEQLEPFLVVKRIPPARLQQHLYEEEPGKACEIIEPPSKGPGGQAAQGGN
jgi:hypothetical protein